MTLQTGEPREKQVHQVNPEARPDSAATIRAGQEHPRRPSRFLLRFFDIYLSLYVPFHFRALRIASPHRFPLDARPLIVVINHPSWWDPLTSILLSRFFLRHADHYAPIDAESLPRHRILAGLGLFPVEQGTARGAVQFLRAAQHILADKNSLLWLTPQGSFTDVRTRPVVLKSGLASLIKRLDRVTVLPLAYEYTFWDEPKPEILALCGEPLVFTKGRLEAPAASIGPDATSTINASAFDLKCFYSTHPDYVSLRTRHPADATPVPTSFVTIHPGDAIAAALAHTQDELATLALTRDPKRFHTVLAGETNLSALRATWSHLAAAFWPSPFRSTPNGPECAACVQSGDRTETRPSRATPEDGSLDSKRFEPAAPTPAASARVSTER